jgi:hypothetical protein
MIAKLKADMDSWKDNPGKQVSLKERIYRL